MKVGVEIKLNDNRNLDSSVLTFYSPQHFVSYTQPPTIAIGLTRKPYILL